MLDSLSFTSDNEMQGRAGRAMSAEGNRQDATARASGARRGGLGRGLDALIPSSISQQVAGASVEIPIDSILPNPYQPRSTLDQGKLDQLAESIRTHGVIQPLIVTAASDVDRYVLIAG